MMKPPQQAIEKLVKAALEEDAPQGDITSETLLPADAVVSAKLAAREDGVLSGEDVFAVAMGLTGLIDVNFAVHDGESFRAGAVLATVNGAARDVLQAERVALNFVQRLCGIATMTAKFVEAVAGTKARIVDTRKTTPGLRVLERYAVRCGGGGNHRYSLSDAVLVKDNHLAVLAASGKSLLEAVREARKQIPHTMTVEVEVDRLDQIEEVLAASVDTILLDNFSLDDLRSGVTQIAGRALVEASGGVTLERVRAIAETGVDLMRRSRSGSIENLQTSSRRWRWHWLLAGASVRARRTGA
jgi:nicotinate-nucleotide pyrophosphorylase (carboxylating)